MQAILCKYPSVTKPSRIKASCVSGSITIGFHEYDVNHSGDANYRKAARKLCKKLGWKGRLISGQIKDSNYVFVFLRHPSR